MPLEEMRMNSGMGILVKDLEKKIRTENFYEVYSLEHELGRGRFAVVKKCREKSSNKEFAAKFMRKRRKGKDCRHEVFNEMAILERTTCHPRLITLHQVYETSNEIILVLEFAAGGELHQLCVADEAMKEREVVRLLRQVLEGLTCLHENNVIHLDIKPQNILLTSSSSQQCGDSGDIKIVDFGLARVVSTDHEIREILGTPDYVAPEVLNYEPVSEATDMWSVGVLCYVMLTGISPFLGDSKQETFLNVSQCNLDFPDDLFTDLSPLAMDFIQSLLVIEPSERATAKACLSHPWLGAGSPATTTDYSKSPAGVRRILPSACDKENKLMGPNSPAPAKAKPVAAAEPKRFRLELQGSAPSAPPTTTTTTATETLVC